MTAFANRESASTLRGLVCGGAAIERAIGFAPARSSEGAGWKNLSLYVWRGESPGCEFEPLGEAVVVFHTGGAREVGVRIGDRWARERSRPGLVTVVPPATRIAWRIEGEVHSCSLHVPPERFANLAEDVDDHDALGRLRFTCARPDSFLGGVVAALADELEQPKERGPLYVETLGDALVLHMLRSYSERTARALPRGGLGARELRLVCERIEASVERGISLEELAADAGLSRSHFARAFRRSTGSSPHRYLTDRRIARARERLQRSDDPLVDVALGCGFSSQAHFTEAFRRATGHTPLAFRRLRASRARC